MKLIEQRFWESEIPLATIMTHNSRVDFQNKFRSLGKLRANCELQTARNIVGRSAFVNAIIRRHEIKRGAKILYIFAPLASLAIVFHYYRMGKAKSMRLPPLSGVSASEIPWTTTFCVCPRTRVDLICDRSMEKSDLPLTP